MTFPVRISYPSPVMTTQGPNTQLGIGTPKDLLPLRIPTVPKAPSAEIKKFPNESNFALNGYRQRVKCDQAPAGRYLSQNSLGVRTSNVECAKSALLRVTITSAPSAAAE